jgi:hypothetical protein
MRGVRLHFLALTLTCAACSAPPPPAAPPQPKTVEAPAPAPAPEPAPVPAITEPAPIKAGVVQTVVEVPPKREPSAEDVLKLQTEVAARRPSSDDEKLRLALLQAAAGNLEESERIFSTIKGRSSRMLPYIELYLRRELGDRKEAAALLARLGEEERVSSGFGIERAELVTRVRRFRDYVAADSDRVLPGGEVHLYVEPRNFSAQRSGDRQTFHLRYEWKLVDDRQVEHPVPAWDDAPADAREDRITSNGPVAEFYQSFRLPLPANLAAGRYRVRVSVTDVVAGKTDRRDVPITVAVVERGR